MIYWNTIPLHATSRTPMQAGCSFVVSNTETAYECLQKDVSFPLTDAQIYALCCSLATSAVFSQVAKSEVVNTISTVPVCVCVCLRVCLCVCLSVYVCMCATDGRE